MISPAKHLALTALGLTLSISQSLVRAEVFSLSGEIVRLVSAGSSTETFGLVGPGGEVIATLESNSARVLLTEGPARIFAQPMDEPVASGSRTTPRLVVDDIASTTDGRDTPSSLTITGPAAYAGNIADRSRTYWAGNGRGQELPSPTELITFSAPRVASEPVIAPARRLSSAQASVVSGSTVAPSSVLQPLVSGDVDAAPSSAVSEGPEGPRLMADLEGSNLRLTWTAPQGAQCLVLGSPEVAGPYEVLSSQTANADGPMSFVLPLTELSGFIKVQISLP